MKFFDKEASVSTYAPYVGFAAGSGLGALGTKLFMKNPKKADYFRNMAKKFHPDKGGSAEKMKDINKAWANIKNTSYWENLSKTAFLRRML